MKLQILSDLHLEFFPGARFQPPEELVACILPFLVKSDVLILAGDICPASHLKALSELLSKHVDLTIFVPGNHEYYGGSTQAADHRISEAESKTFVVLKPGTLFSYQGTNFVGSTLWFPDPGPQYKHNLSDFAMIQGCEPWIYSQNKLACRKLKSYVHSDTVVITHHVPTAQSIPAPYAGSPLNAFFVCDLTDLIKERQPKLWIHGHTHFSFNYEIGKTRIVCNPFGYYNFEQNNGFMRDLIVEV